MRTFLVTVGAALAAAALLAVATDPQIVAPSRADAGTAAKAVKGDRLDIGRRRVCSGADGEAAREQNCVRSPSPTKSAPLARSVVVELAPGARTASWHG